MERVLHSFLTMAVSFWTLLALGALTSAATASDTSLILLQQASATYSQEGYGGYPVAEAIDGIFSGVSHGWAIAQNDNLTNPETAVFETVDDLTAVGPITFQLHRLNAWMPRHAWSRFARCATSGPRAQP